MRGRNHAPALLLYPLPEHEWRPPFCDSRRQR
nr:MAG TPA: hypothetical protein [Caudoviricetes sp.]